MLEGIAIQVDICEPYTVFTRAKKATDLVTRGPKRTQVKLWILVRTTSPQEWKQQY